MYKCICGYKTSSKSTMESHLRNCYQAKRKMESTGSSYSSSDTSSFFNSCCSTVSDYVSGSSSYDSGSSYSGGGGSFDGGGSSGDWQPLTNDNEITGWEANMENEEMERKKDEEFNRAKLQPSASQSELNQRQVQDMQVFYSFMCATALVLVVFMALLCGLTVIGCIPLIVLEEPLSEAIVCLAKGIKRT